MPALPPVPGVMRLTLKHTLGSDIDAVVRLYFQYTGSAPTATTLTTMCGTIATAWGTGIKADAPSDCTLATVELQDLATSTGATGQTNPATAGTRAGGVLPAQTCALINYTVSRHYRGGKPRSYLPYLTQSDILTGQTWVVASINGLATAWQTFITAIIAAGAGGTTIANQCNVSFYSGFTVVTNPVTGRARNVAKPRVTPLVDAITSMAGSPRFATQRRRTTRK